MAIFTEEEFCIVDEYIRANYGLNLEKKQYLVECRLHNEFEKYCVGTFSEYWSLLRCDKTGVMEQNLLNLLTTNYTYFCREGKHFDFLRENILPKYSCNPGHQVNFWCAGCSTGQESYTLAMLLSDCRDNRILTAPFGIIGTDISEKVLETARAASYAESDYERIPDVWRQKFCEPLADGKFNVNKRIHESVRYYCRNLMKPCSEFGSFDVIFCRNVLIYFKEKERATVVANLINSLAPGGYLFIGHTESLLGCDAALDYVRPAVYRKPEENHA